MIVKEHRSKSGTIVALCDEDLAGKKYSENGLLLDLSSDFYAGEKINEKDAEKKCKRAYIVNAVGEKSVGLIKRLGFVGDENIKKIKNIPFAQCLLLQNEL